jgi:hypothetical protein
VAGEVAGVVGAGVVGPGEGPGGPVVADGEVGDLAGEAGRGGELALVIGAGAHAFVTSRTLRAIRQLCLNMIGHDT